MTWIVQGKFKTYEVHSLDKAMICAKSMNEFVIIKNGDTEIVGKFGVDSVQDGKCPDGIEYSWVKRRIAQKL